MANKFSQTIDNWIGAREVFWGLLIKTDNFYFVRFFCFLTFLFFAFFGYFEPFGALSGYFWGWGGAKEDFWGLLIKTDNFYIVRYFVFWLLYFFCSGVILSLLGPYRAFLGVGVGSENFFGLYVYRLTTFDF